MQNNSYSKEFIQKVLRKFNLWYNSFNNDEKIEIESEYDESEDSVQERLFTRISKSISNYDQNIGYNYSNRKLNTISIAASIIILIPTLLLFNIFENNPEEKAKISQSIIQSNPTGIVSKITLPDSSTVWLNAESRIKISKDYNLTSREITLDGEAFFEVNKNPAKPFIVNTKGIKTTVLGTSFNIKSYKNESSVVTVLTGIVKVNSKSKVTNSVTLVKNKQATLLGNNALSVREVDAAKTNLWKKGILHFEKTNLSEVIATLERWYNVKFNYNNPSILERVFVGEFDNERLFNILESIKFSLNINYSISGRNVKLY